MVSAISLAWSHHALRAGENSGAAALLPNSALSQADDDMAPATPCVRRWWRRPGLHRRLGLMRPASVLLLHSASGCSTDRLPSGGAPPVGSQGHSLAPALRWRHAGGWPRVPCVISASSQLRTDRFRGMTTPMVERSENRTRICRVQTGRPPVRRSPRGGTPGWCCPSSFRYVTAASSCPTPGALWSMVRDLNSRPAVYDADALPLS
jgi:hypothetical protein